MTEKLPLDANVENLKKQAKRLLKSCKNDKPEAINRLRIHHPDYAKGSIDINSIRLQEVQLVVARELGATSWPNLVKSISNRSGKSNKDTSGILLFTNGGHAIDRLNEIGIPGSKQEWLEVLHEGPCPQTDTSEAFNRVRARHFASKGWGEEEETYTRLAKRDSFLEQTSEYESLQLWFEHDLYDQLQLVHLLASLAKHPGWQGKTHLAQFDSFIGRSDDEALKRGIELLQPVSKEQISIAAKTWDAFRQETPTALEALIDEGTRALPHLKSAILRLCQEFPSATAGIGRTERQILTAVENGPESPGTIFRSSQKSEEAEFMGDASFFSILERMMRGREPLIRLQSRQTFINPTKNGYSEEFRNQRILITDTGRQTLKGEFDRLSDLPEPYWIGGVRIDGKRSWRYLEDERNFLKIADR